MTGDEKRGPHNVHSGMTITMDDMARASAEGVNKSSIASSPSGMVDTFKVSTIKYTSVLRAR